MLGLFVCLFATFRQIFPLEVFRVISDFIVVLKLIALFKIDFFLNFVTAIGFC